MEILTDLHLHSSYSRAVSPQMTLEIMVHQAKKKGIHLLSASDWTHPLWFSNLEEKLVQNNEGIYKLKGFEQSTDPSFLLSTEVSNIYSHNGKLRRIHNLLFIPNLETAKKVNKKLTEMGAKLASDGRPILGMSSKQILEIILEAHEHSFLIPAHAWTPHFGIFGSASGYESLQEAFEDLTPYVNAIETGLSSDPVMNWGVEELKNRAIVSFSDAHSPNKIGREITVVKTEKDYSFFDIKQAFSNNGESKVSYTIEFYPEEGKYHFSGHRNCGVSLPPEQAKANGRLCPRCGKPLTEGVIMRLDDLTTIPMTETKEEDTSGVVWKKDTRSNRPKYVSLVPLLEIIQESYGVSSVTKKVQDMYDQLIKSVGTEFDILLKIPLDTLRSKAGEKITEGIEKVRKGDIVIIPGYDGVYGVVKIWKEEQSQPEEEPQLTLL